MIFSIVRAAQSRSPWAKSTKSPPSRPPPHPQLLPRPQLLQHHSQQPLATKRKLTSISSTEMGGETSIELEATTEAKEAAADQRSTGNRVTHQPETPQTTIPHRHPPLPSRLEPVVGTVASETRLENATRNVPFTKPSMQHRSREMAKGAVECERGDPLLLIKRHK